MLQNNKTVARFQIKTGNAYFRYDITIKYIFTVFSLLLAAVVCLNL